MKTNLTELRKISRRLWETLRSSDDCNNVFYILSLMLIQHLSLSNENKKIYFKTHKDFFQLMRPSENLDKEVNEILEHFTKVNSALQTLVKRADFTKIGRTQESRNRIIRQFVVMLTEIQKEIELREIPSSMRVLTSHLKHYYFWNNEASLSEIELDSRAEKLLFQFWSGRENQEIYNPHLLCGEIMDDMPDSFRIEKAESISIYGSNSTSSEFAIFMMLDGFFCNKPAVEFHIRNQTFYDAPFLDSNKLLKKFDLITTLPILFMNENPDIKKLRKLQNILTVKIGNTLDFKDFIFSFLLSSLKDDGVLNMIIPYSFLTAEKYDLRKYLVENDMILHVENLPMNVFTGKSVDAAFVSVYKNKSSEMKGKTAFRAGIGGKAKLVQNKKISDNNYNLSVNQYITDAPILTNEKLEEIFERLDKINSEIRSRIYDLRSSIK
jgi:hypothetical protein